jgi:hypothetical protein
MRTKIEPPKDAKFASLLIDLAGATEGLGRSNEALAIYRDAPGIRENLFGPTDQSVAEIYAAMASVYQWMKDPAQARRTMQYALEIRQRAGKEQSTGFADLLDDSAGLYSEAGDEPHAESEYERAIAIREYLWRTSDPRFVDSLRQTARQTRFAKAPGLAEKLFRRIVEIERAAHKETSEEYYTACMDLANFLRSRKRFEEAEHTFVRALTAREKAGKKDAQAAFCMEQIARCRMARGMYNEAAAAGEASLQLRSQLEKPAERNTARSNALLAEVYLRAHDPKKAEACFRALYDTARPSDQYTLIETAKTLSTIYEERGDYPQAAMKLELELAAIEAGNPADGRLPEREIRLARLYQLMGRANDASRMNMAALRAIQRNATNQVDKTRLKYR